MPEMEGQHKPARSVLERLSWGKSSEAGKDDIVTTEDGLAGVIFMCNKKTKEKCLIHGVFGLPETRQDLVEQVVPGMKLFLFEYESRSLFGIFESTSYGAINLEPDAFLGQESSFPAQVYFQEIAECMPLLEREFKAAIHENYYTPVKFSLDLTLDQVKKLIRLFQQVSLNAKGLHSVRQRGHLNLNGRGDFPDRDFEEVPAGNLKLGRRFTHDKSKDLDKTTRAASTLGKSQVHPYEDKINESANVLENELRNSLLKRMSRKSGTLSQNSYPDCSTSLLDESSSRYVPPFVSDSALYRAENISMNPEDIKFPIAGKENWSNDSVLPTVFGNNLEQSDVWNDPSRTRIRTPRAGSLMDVLPYAGRSHDSRVDALSPKVQGLNCSHVKGNLVMPSGIISEIGPSVLTKNTSTSFSAATLTPNGNRVGVDMGAAACQKAEPFDSKTVYARTGNYTQYDRVQFDGHLSCANELKSKDQTCPQSSYGYFDSASAIENLGNFSLDSKLLPPSAQQGIDVGVNPSSQSINNEFSERPHPCGSRDFERWDANSVVPHSLPESEELERYKNYYSHGFLKDVQPACLDYSLDRVKNLLDSQAVKKYGSETLLHTNALSTLSGGHKSQSSDDSELKRIYELVQGLLLRKETADHSRPADLGNSLTFKTPVDTTPGEAYPSRRGIDGCDDHDYTLALDEADKKQKQSVWSRISGLNGRDLDRSTHVIERRDVEALPLSTLYASRGNSLKPGHCLHPRSIVETIIDDDVEDSDVLHNEDTFKVNFKRRKGPNVTSNDEAVYAQMADLQGSSQLEKDTRKSLDATTCGLPKILPKRRKLIRPEIHDAIEGQVANSK